MFMDVFSADRQRINITLEELYKNQAGKMFYIANSILRNPDLAEDAVQDSFIKLIGYVDRLKDGNLESTLSLLYKITRTTALDLLRRQKNRNHVSIDDYNILEDYFITGCYSVTENETLQAVHQLPDKYAVVLLLKYHRGYANYEIAYYLKIKETTVRTRIKRAKELLLINLDSSLFRN